MSSQPDHTSLDDSLDALFHEFEQAPRKTVSFAERASAALADFLYDQTLPERLFAIQRLLGTAGVKGHDINNSKDPEVERVVLQTLIAMVHQYDPFEAKGAIVESFILEGLLQRDHWRALLDTEHNARAFVVMVAHHLGSLQKMTPVRRRGALTRGDVMVRRDVTDRLHATLDSWLGLDLAAAVTTRDVARKLFGEAWCMLVVDGYTGDLTVAEIIMETRPPFVPGWVSNPCEQPSASLPDLDLK